MTPYTKNIETFLSGFGGDQVDEYNRQLELSGILIRNAEKENAGNPHDEEEELEDYPEHTENFNEET